MSPIGAGFTLTEETPTIGSPKSGSACSNPRNSYLSEVIPDCPNLLTRPELYLTIFHYCFAVSKILNTRFKALFAFALILITSSVSSASLPSETKFNPSFDGIEISFAKI